MKIIGNVFTTLRSNQGLKTSAKGAKYAHLTLSVGIQQLVRDAAGAPVIGGNGQAKTEWVNTYYNLSVFNELATHIMGLIEEGKKSGKKVISLEVSGELTPGTYDSKKNPGEKGVSLDLRVISARTPGETEWFTTQQGKLIKRALN